MPKKNVTYSPTIPKTVSVRELQREYRAVSNRLNEEGTIMVMNYSEPDMVLMSKKKFQKMQKQLAKMEEELEIQDTLRAYKRAKKAEKEGTLIKADSIADLL